MIKLAVNGCVIREAAILVSSWQVRSLEGKPSPVAVARSSGHSLPAGLGTSSPSSLPAAQLKPRLASSPQLRRAFQILFYFFAGGLILFIFAWGLKNFLKYF